MESRILKSLFLLFFLEYKFFIGVFMALIFLAAGFFDVSLTIESIMIWFFIVAILKLTELRILIDKFTSEHHSALRRLMGYLKGILEIYALPFSMLTAAVFYVWHAGVGNVVFSCIWLLSLIVLVQVLLWYLTLRSIISRGSFNSSLLAIVVLVLIMLGLGEGSARFALVTGISRLIDFAIVMGGSGISLSLFYNFIGYLSWMTPQEIRSNQDLNMKSSKLREIKGECLQLLPKMYTKKMIPMDAEVTTLVNLDGPSNCYISVKKKKRIKFFHVEKHVEITDENLLRQFKLTLSLKDALKAMPPIQIKRRWNSIKQFLIFSRLVPHMEKGRETFHKVGRLPISQILKNLEEKMYRSDFEVQSGIKDFGYKASRVGMMLSILDEVASTDIATEICKEVRSLQASLKRFRIILEKRGKLWEKYEKERPFTTFMPKPPQIEDIKKSIEWLSPIIKACKQVD